MASIQLTKQHTQVICGTFTDYRKASLDPFTKRLVDAFGGFVVPQKMRVFGKHVYILQEESAIILVQAKESALDTVVWSITPQQAAVVKTVVTDRRRAVAMSSEQSKSKTLNDEIIESIDLRLSAFSDIFATEWFRAAKAFPPPRLTEFVTVQEAEKILEDTTPFSERQYDEKCHILQAPSLFLQDLSYYRSKCEMRGVSLAAAFIDIDTFKGFNTKYGHTKVDRKLLPRFMETMENHVFARGYAYRFGGDEYAMCLPNMDLNGAVSLLQSFQAKLAGLSYQGIDENTTVSIGCCIIGTDCYLTEREIEERVNRAANFAKEQGKDCIAYYKGTDFNDSELTIVGRDAAK